MACGGGTELPCSGHGRCLSMARLAREARVNGELADFTYGSDANAAETWDAHRVHGCLCDAGYSGYDCSQRICPHGDDPGTYDDHSEVQLYRCVANGGNFTLSFRSEATPLIGHNVSSAELQQYLARLPSLSHVSVYFLLDNNVPNDTFVDFQPPSKVPGGGWLPPGGFNANTNEFEVVDPTAAPPRYNTSFCDPQGDQVAVVVFTHTHGDLPPLRFNTSHLVNTMTSAAAAIAPGRPGSGEILSYQDGRTTKGMRSFRGTTEDEPCNGRGLCDMQTGECSCLQDWTSSDGSRQGGPGRTGDCGTRNVFQFSSFTSLGSTKP